VIAANAAREQWSLPPPEQREILAVSVAGHRFTGPPSPGEHDGGPRRLRPAPRGGV
jgi:hypothetical protein